MAFDQLKQLLGQAPILSHPLTEGHFILDTNASSEGIGVVLSQMQVEEEKVIAYGSKSFSKAEQMRALGSGVLCPIVQALSPWEDISHQNRQLSRTFLDEVTVRLI